MFGGVRVILTQTMTLNRLLILLGQAIDQLTPLNSIQHVTTVEPSVITIHLTVSYAFYGHYKKNRGRVPLANISPDFAIENSISRCI